MRTCIAELVSTAPYSQARELTTPKLPRESASDHDARCWRDRIHANEAGDVFVPQMALKFALVSAASHLGQKIEGRGNKTFKGSFLAGVLIPSAMYLGIHRDDVRGESFFVHANGQRGSGKRVHRTFPMVDAWQAAVEFIILDDLITPGVFERHLKAAGSFVGIGRFRPENGGHNGRFRVAETSWSELEV